MIGFTEGSCERENKVYLQEQVFTEHPSPAGYTAVNIVPKILLSQIFNLTEANVSIVEVILIGNLVQSLASRNIVTLKLGYHLSIWRLKIVVQQACQTQMLKWAK